MKILHTRKQLFIFFMPGFLAGILYINLLAKQYVAEPGIFSDYFLKQFGNGGIYLVFAAIAYSSVFGSAGIVIYKNEKDFSNPVFGVDGHFQRYLDFSSDIRTRN